MRTMSGSSLRGGMKSIARTVPSSVSKTVSRTSVSCRYRRVVRRIGTAGASSQRPCSGVPSSDAKHAPESKRGKQHQSIEPSRLTSADV